MSSAILTRATLSPPLPHTPSSDLRREKRLTVTVHPDVVDSVSKEFARLGVSGRIEVTIEGNPTLDRTACIIASDLAVVDASVQTQLAAIAAAIGAV